MKRFEYWDAVMTERDDTEKAFAGMGEAGWEMVGVVRVELGFRCFFKRELTDG